MDQRTREFIDFMQASDVLLFGDFVTKSGRETPYFINTGRYATGSQMEALGSFYARAIVDAFGDRFDVLFGPAYKGIPLVVATAIALHRDFGRDVPLCFNRKEAKSHGERGVLVGHAPVDGERVLFVEDVTTAGTSIRETVPILTAAADVRLAGLIVSVDRMERGPSGEGSALREIGREFGMPTASIATLDDIVEHLTTRAEPPGDRSEHASHPDLIEPGILDRLLAYRAHYGVRATDSEQRGTST